MPSFPPNVRPFWLRLAALALSAGILVAALSGCTGTMDSVTSGLTSVQQGMVGSPEAKREYDEFEDQTMFYNSPVVGELEEGGFYYLSVVAFCEGDSRECAPSQYGLLVGVEADEASFGPSSDVDLVAGSQRFRDLNSGRRIDLPQVGAKLQSSTTAFALLTPAAFEQLATASGARLRVDGQVMPVEQRQQKVFQEVLVMVGPNAAAGGGAAVAEAPGSGSSGGSVQGLPAGCEDNTDFACAKRLAVDATIEGRATVESGGLAGHYGQPQYFYIEPERAGILDIEMAPMPPNMTGRVEVLDASENDVVGVGDASALLADYNYGSAVFVSTPVRAEKYYVLVDPTTEDRGAEYQVKLALDTEDTYEVNDSFAEAKQIQVGETVQGKIKPSGDEDGFKIEVGEGGTFEVAVESVPRTVEIDVLAFNRRQERIAREYGSPGRNTYLTFEADAGTYYVVLSGGEERSDDFYELTVRRTGE